MLVLMAGLPGTGKTTLAREIARRTSGTVLNKDEIRAVLFPPEDVEYSSVQDDFCMQVLLDTAEYLLSRNPRRKIFVDGRPFSRRVQIEEVIDRAKRIHQPWRIIECTCSEETARKRLEAPRDQHPAANRNYDLYLELKRSLEPIVVTKAVIDTDAPLEQCVEHALSALS